MSLQNALAMFTGPALRTGIAVGLVSLGIFGCAASTPASEGDPEATGQRGVVGGTPASDYAELVVLTYACGQEQTCFCMGTLLAPSVAVTTAACVQEHGDFEVIAPFVGQSTRTNAVSWAAVDPADAGGPNALDLGVVYLATPIGLPSYPTVAAAPVTNGTQVTALGVSMRDDGDLDLDISPPFAAEDGAILDFPKDYVTNAPLEWTDVGGGVFIAGTHTLVGVTSSVFGGQAHVAMIARVDLDPSLQGYAASPEAGDVYGTQSCHHDVCTASDLFPLSADCNPCAAAVCAIDPKCCEETWDDICVSEVLTTCQAYCEPRVDSPCTSVPAHGTCIGQTAIACVDGVEMSADCAVTGEACDYRRDLGWECVAP